MPVLRQHDVVEFARQGIDQGDNLVTARHGEATAGTKVVLDVDNEKRIALADGQSFFQAEILSFSPTSAASLTKASATSTESVLSGSSSCSGCFQAPKMGTTC
jgi:hypothetical protein